MPLMQKAYIYGLSVLLVILLAPLVLFGMVLLTFLVIFVGVPGFLSLLTFFTIRNKVKHEKLASS